MTSEWACHLFVIARSEATRQSSPTVATGLLPQDQVWGRNDDALIKDSLSDNE
jgi:hypothetical protein